MEIVSTLDKLLSDPHVLGACAMFFAIPADKFQGLFETIKQREERLIRERSKPQIMIPTEGRVLVDFYATWCGPCNKVAKQLDKYEKEVDDVKVIKINIDEEADLASEYGIRSIPALFYMEDGEVVDMHIGNAKLEQLKTLTKI